MTEILMKSVRGTDNTKRSVIGQNTATYPKELQSDAPAYAASIELHVDARDTQRSIIHVLEKITLSPDTASFGPRRVTVMYPEWLPGYHSPEAPIELLSGLRFRCNNMELDWSRDPVAVHAFHIELPDGANELEMEFQLLCATAEEQGRVGFTPRHLNLQWNSVVLYPAGYLAKQTGVRASISLPEGWQFACALEPESAPPELSFARTPLNTVVDSPLFAGSNFRKYQLDRQIALNVFADDAKQAEIGEKPLAQCKNLIAEADKLFGTRHFRHYDFLVAASDELGSLAVEHHESAEIVVSGNFFSEWEATASKNSLLAHEFVHSWNGKFRRGQDSCQGSYDEPIENSLMWVYEGLTQYWGEVLATRSGLWTPEKYLGSLARSAAQSANVKGRSWRPLSDTTQDPIIASRKPLPWLSWQRSEDYYSDGKLIWLDVDTRLRQQTNDECSLDDFAREFFGIAPGSVATIPYEYWDVTSTLNRIAPFEWETYFYNHLWSRNGCAPLEGITRGGYALVFRDKPNDFQRETDKLAGIADLTFSLGLSVDDDGKVKEVVWDSPAFHAGLTAGSEILAVSGCEYSPEAVKSAVEASTDTGVTRLLIKRFKHCEEVEILYNKGARYPHLIRGSGEKAGIDAILAARSF